MPETYTIDRTTQSRIIANDIEECSTISKLAKLLPHADEEERSEIIYALFEVMLHTPGMTKLLTIEEMLERNENRRP